MGFPLTDIRCKRHPKQRQSPGVCSACLRERLTQLSTHNNKITTASSCSSSISSTSPSSSVMSSVSSPVRSASMKGTISLLFKDEDELMRRSKSVAFVARPKRAADHHELVDRPSRIGSRKKKSGFWSKLIGGSGGKRKYMKEVLKQSKSIKKTQANQLV